MNGNVNTALLMIDNIEQIGFEETDRNDLVDALKIARTGMLEMIATEKQRNIDDMKEHA